jgi:predicted PurR-regulated permease PerM
MTSSGPSARAVAKVFLVVAGLTGLLYFLWQIRSVLELVFVSAFLAVALGPAVEFFTRRRVPRAASILLVYLLMTLSIFGVGLLVVPPIVNQVDQLSRDLPGYVDNLRHNRQFAKYDDKYHITNRLNDQARKLPSHLGEAATALSSVTVGVFGAAVKLLTVLTMTFFLLLDGGKVVGFFLRIRGPDGAPKARKVLNDIYTSTAGYVAGNLLISVIAGLVTWIALMSLGVPFAVPLAVLVAFLDLIPLVGATLGSIIVGIVTLFHDFPTATIVWLVITLVYQQVENNVLQPVVYRRTVDVHPLLVIVAILIGSTLLGVLGALLAIPIAAAIQIVVKDVWREHEEETPVVLPGEVEAPVGEPR